MQAIDKRHALFLFVGALLIRAVYLLSIRDSPLFDVPKIDTRVFWETALRLVQGPGPEPVYFKPPLFSWLLAGVIRIFGESLIAARVVMVVLSATAAPLTAWLAGLFLDRKSALLSGAMVALYAPAVFYGAEVLPATVVLVLNLLLLISLVKAEGSRDWRLAALAGVLLGLSACTRPTILLFLPLLLWRYRHWRPGAVALLLSALFLICPVTLHNVSGGSAVLISSNGGLNFYMGNNETSDGKSARAPGLPNDPFEAREAAAALAQKSSGGPLDAAQVSNHWYGEGLAWMRADPVGAAGLWLRKLYYFFNDREIADNIDFYAVQGLSWPLRLVPFRFGLLLAFSVPGVMFIRRRRETRLLLLYGLAVVVPVVMFFMVGRFRLPFLPVVAVAASAGFWELLHRWRFSRRQAARPTLLLLLGLLLAFSRLLGVAEDTSWHYYYQIADTYYRKGRIEAAMDAYEESIRRNDRIAGPRNALAFLYAEKGTKLDRAEELVQGAIDLDPRQKRYYLDSLGWILYKQGELDDASRALREAIPLFEADEERPRAEAMYHLGHVLRAQGLTGEAERLFRKAAQHYPAAAAELPDESQEAGR